MPFGLQRVRPAKTENAFSFSISRRKWARSIGFLTAPLCISFRLQAAVFGCYRQTSGFSLHQNLRHGTRVERTRVMPAGIAVDATPATRLPPRHPHSPPSYREVGDLIGVNDGKGGNSKVGPRSPEQRHRGAGPSGSGRGSSSIRDAGDLSEDDDVGVDPRTPTNRAAPPSYEDALLSSRRVPPKSPPRPGHEHEGEKKKTNDTASSTVPFAAHPAPLPPRIGSQTVADRRSHPPNHSQREQSTMRSGFRSPRACQRGECERAIAAPREIDLRASDRRDPRRAPHRPLTPPSIPPSRSPQIRGDPRDLPRRASQAAHRARGPQGARVTTARPPRLQPRTAQHPRAAQPGAFLTLTNRLTRPFPDFDDDFHRLRRPRRGSPAEKRDAHSP